MEDPMADTVADGMTRVVLMTACANTAAPTVAELNAGLQVTLQITPDGMEGWEAETGAIDNRSLGSTFMSDKGGTDSFPSRPLLRFKRQMPTDTVRTTCAKGVALYVGIRRDVLLATAWTAGQVMAVHTVECGRRKDIKPESNTLSRFEIPFFLPETPSFDAVVAA